MSDKDFGDVVDLKQYVRDQRDAAVKALMDTIPGSWQRDRTAPAISDGAAHKQEVATIAAGGRFRPRMSLPPHQAVVGGRVARRP
jgi:hypothetical protein